MGDAKETQAPFAKNANSGYEFMAQIRPSTGTPDQKESLQITARAGCMDGRWPHEPLDSKTWPKSSWRSRTALQAAFWTCCRSARVQSWQQASWQRRTGFGLRMANAPSACCTTHPSLIPATCHQIIGGLARTLIGVALHCCFSCQGMLAWSVLPILALRTPRRMQVG